MIIEGESIGDYDARNAAEAGKTCGEINTARWHLRRGLKPSELDAACSQAYRAFHRRNNLVANRVRQRTLTALKDAHLPEFEGLRDHYRIEVDFHSIGRGEDTSPSVLANRARQMGMRELAKRYRDEYQRIYTAKLIEVFTEEVPMESKKPIRLILADDASIGSPGERLMDKPVAVHHVPPAGLIVQHREKLWRIDSLVLYADADTDTDCDPHCDYYVARVTRVQDA